LTLPKVFDGPLKAPGIVFAVVEAKFALTLAFEGCAGTEGHPLFGAIARSDIF